jgi:hypothetical protein
MHVSVWIIIRPLNDRRRIHNQYDPIMIDKDAICVILIIM